MKYYKGKTKFKKIKEWLNENKKRVAMGAFAVGIGIGGASLAVNDNNNNNNNNEPIISIVKTVDDKEVPLYVISEGEETIYELKENSLGIVEGKVGEDKRCKIIIMDPYTDVQEGYIDKENIETLKIMKSDEAEKYSKLYKVTAERGVNIRKTPEINDDNKVVAVEQGTFLLVSETKISSSKNKFCWRSVLCVRGNGEVVKGMVAEDFLQEIDLKDLTPINDNKESKEEIIKKQVDTSMDGYVNLNMREQPSLEGKKIAKLQHGTIIIVDSENLEKGNDWVKVQLEDGTEGYVSQKYLVDYESKEKKQNNHQMTTKENKNGKVIGIDVSYNSMDSKTLEKLICNEEEIEDKIKTENAGTKDLSNYTNKKIQFVCIKLGASGYGKGQISQVKPEKKEKAKALAEVCEKHKIPYGFYYYSTCVNEKEAETEAGYIRELLKYIEENMESTEYNVLPLAIDVELANNPEKDRQAGQDVNVLTKAKAKLTSELQKDENTILYSSRNVLDGRYKSKIMDFGDYNDEIAKNGGTPSDIWFVNPAGKDEHDKSKENLENEGANIPIEQIVQDGYLDGACVDIDAMDEDYFNELIKSIPKNNKNKEEDIR